MKIKKFKCIIDNGDEIFREYIPATSKRQLMDTWCDMGDFIKIIEMPGYLPSAAAVRKTLSENGYGKAECDFVYRILSNFVEGTEAD